MTKRLILHTILALCIFVQGLNAQKINMNLPEVKTWGMGQDTVRVMFVGDIMMHKAQITADYKSFLKPIAPAMKAADICVGNLEFTLAGKPYSGYPAFSTPDDFATHLAVDCGIDVFLTANNHILDKGNRGIKRTLERYGHLRDSLGILYTGSATDSLDLSRNNPLFLVRKGIRIALVNFTYGTNVAASAPWPKVNTMDSLEIKTSIEKARSKGADYIVALPHWGIEYETEHSTQQEYWARRMIAWGADAIVGTHPHVVQDYSQIDGKAIFYSLGNLVSNMTKTITKRGMVVSLIFVRDKITGEKRMLEPQIQYTWCTIPGNLVDFIKERGNQ